MKRHGKIFTRITRNGCFKWSATLMIASLMINVIAAPVSHAQSVMKTQTPPVKFKRVKITIKSGKVVQLKDAYWSNGVLFGKSIFTERDDSDFQLFNNRYKSTDIINLKYSNRNAGGRYALIGGLVGATTTVLLIASSFNKLYYNFDSGYGGLVPSTSETVLLLFMPAVVGAGVGYLVGRNIYVGWKDYDLSQLSIDNRSLNYVTGIWCVCYRINF